MFKVIRDNAGTAIGSAGAAGATYITASDPAAAMEVLLSVVNNELAQAGFFFALAAWIHSGRVKKEISKNFASITDAINNVASALRQDLQKHGERLDNISDRVETLEKANKGD